MTEVGEALADMEKDTNIDAIVITGMLVIQQHCKNRQYEAIKITVV